MQPGEFLGDAQSDWSYAIANLHNLALTIGEARQAGQFDAANALKPQFQYWLGQAQQAAQDLYGQEMPGSVMLSLQQFSDFIAGTATSIASTLSTDLTILVSLVGVGLALFLWQKAR